MPASRPVQEPSSRAQPIAIAAALAAAVGASLLLRTGMLDAGYWIDEAIAVGIASRDLADIPAALRQDGSPPLYYLLLHGWMAARRHERGGDPGAVARLRAALGARGVLGRERAVRPPRRRLRRRGRGRLPVPHVLRAGDADVHAGGRCCRCSPPRASRWRSCTAAAVTCRCSASGACCCSTPTPGRCSWWRGWRSRGCCCGARAAWTGATARGSAARSRCCTRRGCRRSCSRRRTPGRRGRRGRRRCCCRRSPARCSATPRCRCCWSPPPRAGAGSTRARGRCWASWPRPR